MIEIGLKGGAQCRYRNVWRKGQGGPLSGCWGGLLQASECDATDFLNDGIFGPRMKESVVILQERLDVKGPNDGSPDGRFGPKTKQAWLEARGPNFDVLFIRLHGAFQGEAHEGEAI